MEVYDAVANNPGKVGFAIAVMLIIAIYLAYVSSVLGKCAAKERMYTSTKRPNPIPPIMDPRDGVYGVAVTIPRRD